jgi:hypothetical protein
MDFCHTFVWKRDDECLLTHNAIGSLLLYLLSLHLSINIKKNANDATNKPRFATVPLFCAVRQQRPNRYYYIAWKRWGRQQRRSCVDNTGQMSNYFNEKKENREERRDLGGWQNCPHGIFWWSRLKTPCPLPSSSSKHTSVQTEVAKTLRNHFCNTKNKLLLNIK